jgi:alpha/beta hydrolase fold
MPTSVPRIRQSMPGTARKSADVGSGGATAAPDKTDLSTATRPPQISMVSAPLPWKEFDMISKMLIGFAASLLTLAPLRTLAETATTAPATNISVAHAPQTDPFADVVHHVVRVNGVRFHYVVAGSGEPVVLLPGWPESWIAWRKMIPLLTASGRQVHVLEPRGFGDSDKPQTGYDFDTAARDLHDFLVATGLNRPGGVDIVAHDVGTWIAHAHAVTYPGDVKRLVLTEAPILGVSPLPSGISGEAINLKL